VRPHLTGYAAALAAVAVVSLAIGFGLKNVSLATGSMLYLLAVLATAVAFGRGPAIFASVVAFLTFDWFFVEPLHQFNVSNPEEWLSLLVFLLTATVTGQLAAGQRQRTREAVQREREAVVLYDVVRLMAEADLDQALEAVAERLRTELLLVHPPERIENTSNRLASAAATQIGLAVDRARLNKEATEAEILRRTDQLRGALLNAVSHDLRTPLATIMASAGSLQQRDVQWTDAEADGFAQAIEEEADHLNRLVGNLLDLSRIEAGSLSPDKSWHDLGALIDDVLDRLRPVTTHHRIRRSIPEDLPPVWLDSVEIGEALYNLIENAAKYAPPQTEIEIAVRREPNTLQVSVADRGPGISPARLPHLFDPFYRAIDSGPHPPGLGLGLAVVKGLVAAHGGQVWAENRVGGGARFVFTLLETESEPEPMATSAVSAA
jgi:two-component system sensor histidine kinase KdpD